MAEKDKFFYWMKLKEEFLNSDEVDFLMSQKNGADYVVLYLILVKNTFGTHGRLCGFAGEYIVPFDEQKIQREAKWFSIDTVRVALHLYMKLGLIYQDKDGILTITDFEEMVGSESYWAGKKRLQRARKKLPQIEEKTTVGQPLDNVQDNVRQDIRHKTLEVLDETYSCSRILNEKLNVSNSVRTHTREELLQHLKTSCNLETYRAYIHESFPDREALFDEYVEVLLTPGNARNESDLLQLTEDTFVKLFNKIWDTDEIENFTAYVWKSIYNDKEEGGDGEVFSDSNGG